MDRLLVQRLKKVCTINVADESLDYCRDWLRKVSPQAHHAVAFPTAVHEVQELMCICDATGTPVVPQGGNTGLVQGSVPAEDAPPSLILSTRKMNKFAIDRSTLSVHCEAGAVLQAVQESCIREGLLFPIDMGSKGSATIGGCVATNAGGIHFFRYGSVRANLLGLCAVLPTGEVADWQSTLRKDNTGYDLKQLFVGAEGTLGIVTSCQMAVSHLYRSRAVLRIPAPTMHHVIRLQAELLRSLGPVIAAFEVLDRQGLCAVGARCPDTVGFVVIVELHTFAESPAPELSVAASVLERLGLEAEVGETETACREMMHEREAHPVKLAALGPIYKFDLCSTLDTFYDVVEYARSRVGDRRDILVTGYGHFGDGNVHLNIVDRSNDGSFKTYIKTTLASEIYQYIQERRGSMSAEHGIGHEKRAYFTQYEPATSLSLMKGVKKVCDPKAIMNPNVIF